MKGLVLGQDSHLDKTEGLETSVACLRSEKALFVCLLNGTKGHIKIIQFEENLSNHMMPPDLTKQVRQNLLFKTWELWRQLLMPLTLSANTDSPTLTGVPCEIQAHADLQLIYEKRIFWNCNGLGYLETNLLWYESLLCRWKSFCYVVIQVSDISLGA